MIYAELLTWSQTTDLILRNSVKVRFVRSSTQIFYRSDFDAVIQKSVDVLKKVASTEKMLACIPPHTFQPRTVIDKESQ